MGTSKGYIAPTTIVWSKTKRAVTELIKETNGNNIAKVSSRFGTAMKTDGFSNNAMPKAVANLINFSRVMQKDGLDFALNQYRKANLIGKSSTEIFDELLILFCNNGSTKEDAIALDALSMAMQDLHIDTLEELIEISEVSLLKEVISNYVVLNFELCFYEKICITKSPKEAKQILDEVREYMRGVISEELNISKLEELNYSNLAQEQYIRDLCRDTYTLFEDLYEE